MKYVFLIRFVHHLVTFAWHNWNITYDKTCVRQKYSRYFLKLRYCSLICYLYPDRDTLYQLSQKCVTYRKYIHRSILHFSLGEVSMGKISCASCHGLHVFYFLQILVIVLVLLKFSNVFLVYVVFMGISMTMCVSCYTRTPILIKTIF